MKKEDYQKINKDAVEEYQGTLGRLDVLGDNGSSGRQRGKSKDGRETALSRNREIREVGLRVSRGGHPVVKGSQRKAAMRLDAMQINARPEGKMKRRFAVVWG